jgi:hypothetical protein
MKSPPLASDPTALDLYDALRPEIDRLGAVAELLGCASTELDPGTLGGVSLLLDDIRRRMDAALKTFRGGGDKNA